jgi:predicted metal-dependent enzyme (double-stranded beta helix superfamily)
MIGIDHREAAMNSPTLPSTVPDTAARHRPCPAPDAPTAPLSTGAPRFGPLSEGIGDVLAETARDLAAGIEACLPDAATLLALLPAAARGGSADGYTRHLVYADPLDRFSAMLLVWRPGQASPVHGHRTWCAYRVLQGTLRERHYRWDAEARVARPCGGIERRPGGVFSVPAGLRHIHALANEGGDRGDGEEGVAISLHIYGVAPEHIATGVNLLVQAA